LKPASLKSYLASLALYQKLRNLDSTACHNITSKMIIKGAENLAVYNVKSSKNRNVATLPVLKILGNELAFCNWDKANKQLFWTTACLAFFGSLRIGELLPHNEHNFDPATTLLWGDIKILDESILLHIKSPKSKNHGGDYVDIFPFAGHNCCPVKALLCLKKLSVHSSDPNKPVFIFNNCKNLTKPIFNSTLNKLLSKKLNKFGGQYTGHSFRAGIPATLARFPEIAADEHILGW
jgi:hypothetical protein